MTAEWRVAGRCVQTTWDRHRGTDEYLSWVRGTFWPTQQRWCGLQRIKTPCLRDTFEFVFAAFIECDARSGGEVFDGLGVEHVSEGLARAFPHPP